MSVYNGMSGIESNLEQSYVLLDLAGQVALRVRLWHSGRNDPKCLTLFIYI